MSVTSKWLILLVEKTEETGVKRRAAARKCRFHCTDSSRVQIFCRLPDDDVSKERY